MFKDFSKRHLFIAALILSIGVLVSSCSHERKKIDVSQVDVTLTADRLDNDLAVHADDMNWLKHKYGHFFDLYTSQIIHLGLGDPNDTVLLKKMINDFLRDSDIVNIYSEEKKVYSKVDDVNTQLTNAFRHYKYYFSDKLIPSVVTFVGGFNYAIVASDSAIGIGLDMYLGSDSKFYPSLQLPNYKIRKMNRSYIAADAIRGWAQTEWEENPSQTDMLSQIIYQGKMLYFLDMVMPDAPDTIKTGYSKKQLEWLGQNEKQIWSFFLDHNLLFNTDPSQTAKYTGDAATTNGFPKESPGNIGQWIGYQIVLSYVKEHSETQLNKLMSEQDYKKIFRDAKYKPKK